MKRGSLIIYDQAGKVWLNTGDAQGDVEPHVPPSGLPYLITDFGELDWKIVKGVDVVNKTLITEDITPVLTDEQQRIQELENQLLLTQEGLL